MKKYFFVLVSFILLINQAVLAKQKASVVPDWHKKAEKVFPAAQYIRAEGEGSTAKAAKSDALNQIAMYFETKTQSITESVENASQFISGEDESFFDSKEMQVVTKVESAADFFCLNFTDVYHDEKHDKYFVMAYIDKKDAALIYESRINALLTAMHGYKNYSETEEEKFLASNALHKAIALGEFCERYIKAENTIYPADSEKYQRSLEEIAELEVRYTALKKNISFAISMNLTEQRYAPIVSTISSTLEKRGFVYSPENAAYSVNVTISALEETYDAGVFVRPSLVICIVDKSGKSVYTYSKAFNRMGAKTLEMTYTRVVNKLKSDIEDNFLAL